jgi:hypothetical protein
MSASPLPEDAPPEPMRTRILLALVAAIVVQLLIPLTYYLREDRYDERFAWRMFSAIRVERCEATAFETRGTEDRALVLSRVVHAAWEQHFERNRRVVIERFLESRCTPDVTRVRIENACSDARGVALPKRVYERTCRTGALRLQGVR